jgi:hypothetical protein
VPSTDKAKLLSQTLDRLRSKLKPASIPSAASEEPASTPTDAASQPDNGGAGPDIFHGDAVLREFVRSFLIWESTTARADAALKKIASGVVDVNEFRVCLPSEMALIIGPTYPRIEERVIALRSSLTQIFKRENRLRLSHLPNQSKKAAAAYLAALTHAPGFVTDRVALLCCGIHGVPVDSRIAAVLEKAKVLDKATAAKPDEAAALIARMVKAGDARDAYALLQAAADQAPVTATRVPKPAPAKAAPAKRPTSRPTPRKSK